MGLAAPVRVCVCVCVCVFKRSRHAVAQADNGSAGVQAGVRPAVYQNTQAGGVRVVRENPYSGFGSEDTSSA